MQAANLVFLSTRSSFLSWQNKYCSKKLSKITKCSNIELLLLFAGDICTNPGPLNFAFSNVRSLKSKYPSIDNFIQSKQSDCFCMTETWLTTSDTSSAISDITPARYTFHHLPRRNKHGGGVGIVIKKLVSHELINLSCVTTY